MPKNYGPIHPRFPVMLHGGDYNPDQWLHDPKVLEEDIRLMKLSGCNTMSIGIFSWARLEPEEGRFEFQWLDDLMDRLAKNGVGAVLATPSGAKPVWMTRKYEEVSRMNAQGVRSRYVIRHDHCRTSPIYRQKCECINRKLAERYKDHPALIVWHVSNEYNGEECHCDLCYAAFQDWLRNRYNNDIEALNMAWWTGFWSHHYNDFSEVCSIDGSVHGLVLDWKRFLTDQTVDFYLNEIRPLRELTPDVPITINMMGTYAGLNYWKFAPHVDLISWDSYPKWHSQGNEHAVASGVGFVHDINRCMKGGRPFMLMESTPSNVNWQEISPPKRPGMHILSSMQAIAHGSDTVQYFQWRKSRGSSEKFHGAVVDHVGHENTRVFREVSELGKLMQKLQPVVGTGTDAEVALIYDWENGWAINEAQGPRRSQKNYQERCQKHYHEFWRRGIPVDVINEDVDFSRYKLLIAPMLYMVRSGVGERITEFVRQGGTFIATYMTGWVNETDLVHLGGFPGPLRKVLGIWAEETDVFYDHQKQGIMALAGNVLGLNGQYEVTHYADIIHPEGATVVAAYRDDFYAGKPALTVNKFEKGEAWYIASRNSDAFLSDFYCGLIRQLKLRRALDADLPAGVSATVREDEKGRYVFLMNFNAEPKTIRLPARVRDLLTDVEFEGSVSLNGYSVRVLKN